MLVTKLNTVRLKIIILEIKCFVEKTSKPFHAKVKIQSVLITVYFNVLTISLSVVTTCSTTLNNQKFSILKAYSPYLSLPFMTNCDYILIQHHLISVGNADREGLPLWNP